MDNIQLVKLMIIIKWTFLEVLVVTLDVLEVVLRELSNWSVGTIHNYTCT